MNLEKAAELMGPNLILPEVFINHLQTQFSAVGQKFLKEIPISDVELLADDIYVKRVSRNQNPVLVKITHILFPLPSIDVSYLVQRLGFGANQKKLFFVNNSEVFRMDRPIYGKQKVEWLLMRKAPIADTLGKNLKKAAFSLRRGDRIPTLLEVLVGMIGYYYSVSDPKKSDQEVGMPFFESRDWFSRILSGKMAWTNENLVVGLNTPESGIYIHKLNAEQSSGIVGLAPIRSLSIN